MKKQITLTVQEFCSQLIKIVPEFKELSQAKQDLEADLVSKQLWKEKEEQRKTIELMKSNNLPISIEQQNKLSEKFKEMRENLITMRYLKAINFAGKVSGKIGTDLLEIIGVDFSPRRGCK